jgi:hypothetical protein
MYQTLFSALRLWQGGRMLVIPGRVARISARISGRLGGLCGIVFGLRLW